MAPFLRPLLCVLALGAAGLYLGALGHVLRHAQSPLPALDLDRPGQLLVLGRHAPLGHPPPDFQQRIQRLDGLLEACADCTAIASGAARGRAVSEAALVAQALPHRAIVLEERARTTRENFAHARPLLEEGLALAVITSRYHLARAQVFAAQEGLEAAWVPAEEAWEWSTANLRAALREAALYWPARWGWGWGPRAPSSLEG